MKKIAFGILMFVGLTASAQEETMKEQEFIPSYKYRISLKDKKNSTFSIKRPEEFLSQRSIERRKRQGLKINESDLPVNKSYIDGIAAKGVNVLYTSKWNNTVIVETTDTTLIEQINQLSYVTATRKVATYTTPSKKRNKNRANIILEDTIPAEDNFYGQGELQIKQLNGIALHEQGHKGQDKVIAIIDGGYYNADVIPYLSNINILGTRDFVNPNSDIYAENSHGMMVLSCIGTNIPGKLVGTAPSASFWLLRSEDGDSEQLIEEDNWTAAIEFADSVGADVVNTSLGYYSFDNPDDNFGFWNLDGKYNIISNSASMVASKGMILCCSAGNEGDGRWKKISPPADASDVLTVGALDANNMNTLFSSLGNTADGRVKPDVMALGGNSTVIATFGLVSHANGTSFSSPIMCGMVASLWSALPNLTSYQIMDIVRKSSDRYTHPDNVFGYGIPDFMEAYEMGKKIKR